MRMIGDRMRVLVTGGAGFIGSHVVDALLARGDAVTVLDNLSSGSLDNLKIHKKSPSFRFIRGDIRTTGAVRRALAGVDVVIHGAAIVGVAASTSNPELTRSVNVDGTVNLLNHSLEKKIKRFVYISSAAIYGEQKRLPIAEDAEPNPLSPYAVSKLVAEQSCRDSYRLKGLETVCLRFFNVYGPRQARGEYAGVMMKFIERLRENEPPIIYGDGRQTRDFVHVSDVVRATLLTLERDVAGEVINIGTGEATSINRLCRMFLRVTGKTHLKPIHRAAMPGDVRRSQADLTKARRLLGYEPKISLEEGVKDLLHRFKQWGG